MYSNYLCWRGYDCRHLHHGPLPISLDIQPGGKRSRGVYIGIDTWRHVYVGWRTSSAGYVAEAKGIPGRAGVEPNLSGDQSSLRLRIDHAMIALCQLRSCRTTCFAI